MEYALDLNPTAPDAAGLPQAQSVTDPAGLSAGIYQPIIFLRARNDLTYAVLQSFDLAQWEVLQTNPGAVGQAVTVFRSLSGSKGFLRLRVTLP